MMESDIDTTPIGAVAAELMELLAVRYPGTQVRAVGIAVEVVSTDGRISTIQAQTDTGNRRDSRSLFLEASELYRPDANNIR